MLTGGKAGTNEEKYELWAYFVQCLDRRSVLGRLQGRRTEGLGDAAQPLQQHGDALPDELVGEFHHSATGA